MTIAEQTDADVAAILSHRHDQGADWWTTPGRKLLKGAPFTTLESALYLLELGVAPEHEALRGVAQLIFDAWREDGRIRTAPGDLYPCHTALAANVLCRMGYAQDARLRRTLDYFLDTQRPDGGWRCEKYSFGHGEETQYSTPYTTLVVLDLFRQVPGYAKDTRLDRAVDFLLSHWEIRRPISPCHYGIGSRFMQVEYPMRGYGLFYYVYVLSFYERARGDKRFQEALSALACKTANGEPAKQQTGRSWSSAWCQSSRRCTSAKRAARAPRPRRAGAKSCKTLQKTGLKPLPNRHECDILPPITHLCRPCDCAAHARGGRIGPMQGVEKTRRVNPNGSYLHEAAPGSGRALRSPDPPLEPQDGSVHLH